MVSNVIELPVYNFTDAHREAIKRARFKTTNVGRTWAIVYDADAELMAQTGFTCKSFEGALRAAAGVYDHEARAFEPEVVEFVAGLKWLCV